MAASALLLAAGLGACADFNSFSAQVSTYGSWPADRKPSTFAFDRLPSQQARGPEQDELEQMALPGLTAAGFTPAAAGTAPDVLVQIGARYDRQDRSPWDDPLWIRPWGPRWAGTPWAGPYWRDYAMRSPDYTREVAVLIRDRASGEALYEARGFSDGMTAGGKVVFTSMFSAAMKNFPQVHSEAQRVTVAMP